MCVNVNMCVYPPPHPHHHPHTTHSPHRLKQKQSKAKTYVIFSPLVSPFIMLVWHV